MRRLTGIVSCVMVLAFSVAADEPDQAGKRAGPKVEIKSKTDTKAKGKGNSKSKSKVAGPSSTAAGTEKSKAVNSTDPRATSLFVSAQNLEKTGKKPGAIALYRDLLIKYPESLEAPDATARLKSLGGKIPAPSEIKPAPPPEKGKFTRPAKPK